MSVAIDNAAEWPQLPLKDVTVDVPSRDPSDQPNTEITYVDISAIDNAICEIVSPKRLLGKDAPSRARRPIEAGDVLFSNVRTYLRNVAQVTELDSPAVASTGFTLLRPVRGKLSSRYLYHLARSDFFIGQVTPQQTGTHYPATSDRAVRDNLIPVPPLHVQDALARLLDELERRRRSASSHLSAARLLVERFRRAVLLAACSGELTEPWREQHRPSVSTTLSGRADVVPRLIDTPSDWGWSRLADIADVRGGVQKGAKFAPGEPTREVPYLRVANVQRGYLNLTEIKTIAVPESKIDDLRLQTGDMLFNEGGDRDKLGRGWVWEGQIPECIHQNHVFRARLHDPTMQPRFFSWFGNTVGADYFEAGGKQTVNLASLNMSTLKALPVPVPTGEEQAEIVRRADALLSVATSLEGRIRAAEVHAERTSQGILSVAFGGGLGPSNGNGATHEG